MSKRRNKLFILGFSALLLVGCGLTSCNKGNDDGKVEEPPITENPNYTEEEDGKYLELVSAPTKVSYVVDDYFDSTGLVVKKYTVTGHLKSEPVTVSDSDIVLSIANGSQLTEISSSLTVNVSLASDPEYQSVSFTISVRDKNRVTVTFKNYDGSILETDVGVLENGVTTYDGAEPTRAPDEEHYYIFDGWYVEGDESQTLIDLETFTFKTDTVLVAHYETREASNTDGILLYALNADKDGYDVVGIQDTDLEGNPITELVIADTFQGLPVKTIGEEAFADVVTLTSVTFGKNITTVSEAAFSGCEGITSLTLNEGLEVIGQSAFEYCEALTSITIPTTVVSIGKYGFRKCSLLKNIDFNVTNENTKLETIGEQAFNNCESVVELVLPNSLVTIDQNAFGGMASLEKISFGQNIDLKSIADCTLSTQSNSSSCSLKEYGVTPGCTKLVAVDGVLYTSDMKTLLKVPYKWGERDENGDLIDPTFRVPDTVETINYCAFRSDMEFRDIYFGENVKTIGEMAFYQTRIYDNEGTHYHYNEKLEVIGNQAFYNTYNKKEMNVSLVMPDSVTTIGDQAFYGGSGLVSFTFGANMENFGANMFQSCSNLKTLSVSENNDKISIGEDNLAVYSKDMTKALFWLDLSNTATSYVMPDTVTEVAASFLSDKTKITSLTLSSNLKIVHDKAFYNLKAVTSEITLPSTLTYIGYQAFKNMSKATIHYDSSLATYIGEEAFSGVNGLDGKITLSADLEFLGEKAFYNCSEITEVVSNTALTSDSLFYGCSALTKVSFTNHNVTKINDSMFYNAKALTTVEFNDAQITEIGAKAFQNCSALTTITIPSTVTTIGQYALGGTGLTEVVIPKAVTNLDTYVFSSAKSLVSVTFEDGSTITALPDYFFSGCSSLTTVSLPETVTTLGKYAFKDCTALTSYTIPASVTTLSDYCFSGSGLVTMVIPDTVTSFGTYMFQNCESLKTVTLPTNLTELPSSTFYGCSSLEMTELPTTVKLIGDYAFANSGIKEFTLLEGQAFSNSNVCSIFYNSDLEVAHLNTTVTTIGNNMFSGCADLTSITGLDNGCVTVIGSSAFRNTSSFTDVGFDLSNVTEIGTSAFYGSAIQSITLPTNETFSELQSSTFYNCKSLTSIVIPANVTSIGSSCFYNCSALSEITIMNPEIEISSFSLSGTNSISKITFNGTMEQARVLFAKPSSLGLSNRTFTIVCNDGTLNVEKGVLQ